MTIDWTDPQRPGFVLFYEDYRPHRRGSGQAEDESYHLLDEIGTMMSEVLVHPHNFIGLIDAEGETLQFYVNDDLSVLIDFIVKDRQGSLQVDATLAQCLALIGTVGPSLKALAIPGAKFTAW